MAGFEYRRRERLATEDRAFSRSSDLRPFGGDDFSNNRASPGNIVRIGTANVSYAIPAGQDGTALSESDLLAGQVNLQNLNLYADLAPEQERRSLFGSFRWEISAVELFADMFATRRESVMRDAQIAANIVVPESNYYRQLNSLFLGQGNLTIAYSFANDLGPIRYETQSDTVSLLAGAAIDLSRQWRAEANITIGRHEDHVRFLNGVDTTSLAPFLSGSTPESAFNPFSDGGGSLPSVLGAIQQHTSSDNSSELDAFGLKLDGPLWRMPGGQARAAFGVERRIDHFEITRTRYNAAGASPILPAQRPGDRTTDGYFAELYLPLLADLPLVSRFDLSLSARHESADTYEGETTPRIGVRWEISPDLALRGAWGTSFKAPRFDQLYLTTTAAYAVATPAQDPFADNGSTGALLLAGGNPSLEPEDAETWTAGLDVHPSWLSGFEFKATYFDVDFANRIGAAGDVLTAIRNPASFAAVLIRDPSPEQIAYYSSLAATIGGVFPADGVELIYDGRLVNVSSQRVRGVDVSASYDLPVAGGELVFFLDASRLLEFSRAPLPNAPTINQLDTLYNPIDLRMRAGLSWSGARWRASATVNYADDYRDTISTPNRKVDSWTTYDLRLGVGLDRDIASQRRTELTLNIQNLLDEDPPFVNNTLGLGFDAVNASPAGRVVSIELRRRW
jgi:outer membrane receptor protein involved in Fe transport